MFLLLLGFFHILFLLFQFLNRDYDELQTLLQLNPITRQLNRVDKSGALREFYSKREESSIEGYDEEIR